MTDNEFYELEVGDYVFFSNSIYKIIESQTWIHVLQNIKNNETHEVIRLDSNYLTKLTDLDKVKLL